MAEKVAKGDLDSGHSVNESDEDLQSESVQGDETFAVVKRKGKETKHNISWVIYNLLQKEVLPYHISKLHI